MPWAKVRPFVPRELKRATAKPLSHEQVLQRVDDLMHERGAQYEADLNEIVDRQKYSSKANSDSLVLDLAAHCLTGKPTRYLSRAALRHCKEMLALSYLSTMLRQ